MKVRYYVRICDSPIIEIPEVSTWSPGIGSWLLDHVEWGSPGTALAPGHDAGLLHRAELAQGRGALLSEKRPRAGARGLGAVGVDLVLDPVLRPQCAVAAGADSSNLRKLSE